MNCKEDLFAGSALKVEISEVVTPLVNGSRSTVVHTGIFLIFHSDVISTGKEGSYSSGSCIGKRHKVVDLFAPGKAGTVLVGECELNTGAHPFSIGIEVVGHFTHVYNNTEIKLFSVIGSITGNVGGKKIFKLNVGVVTTKDVSVNRSLGNGKKTVFYFAAANGSVPSIFTGERIYLSVETLIEHTVDFGSSSSRVDLYTLINVRRKIIESIGRHSNSKSSYHSQYNDKRKYFFHCRLTSIKIIYKSAMRNKYHSMVRIKYQCESLKLSSNT